MIVITSKKVVELPNVKAKGSEMLILGTSSNDDLIGLPGVSDTFAGLQGNDRLRGNGGAGLGTGGDHDAVDYSFDFQAGGSLPVRVNLWAGGVQGGLPADTGIDGFGFADSIAGIQDVIGTPFNDVIHGGGHSNFLFGGAGRDLLSGHKGNDRLFGELGADKLIGGRGADHLYGGAGKDAFIYTAARDSTPGAKGRDVIHDFKHGQRDKVNLHRIDADTTAAGNQDFTFIGNEEFHNMAGELHFSNGARGVILSGDLNGDGLADFAVSMKGVATLLANDFVL